MSLSVDDEFRLRTQMSQVTGLSALSMLMFDRRDDREILDLAVSALPSLGRCRVLAACLAGEGDVLRVPEGDPLGGSDLVEQLVRLDGADGPVANGAARWAWAYALRAMGGLAGYVVVGADEEPPGHEQFLLRMLAQQTASALTSAMLHRRERATAAELRRVNVELLAVNEQLCASVAALERRRRIHEVLTAVAVSGGGERGIAAAVHHLTGLPVAVEDAFGNLRVWAGPGRPDSPDRSASRRAEMLTTARASARPLRDRDRVVALAQSRDEVLGVLALVDPDGRAGEHELVALEEGAVMLAMELAHVRALAETELRLRRDLVEDLLSGTDDGSAVSRAAAIGHDLSGPHQVLVVSWTGRTRDEAVEQAVKRAVATTLQAPALLAPRPGGVVAVVARPTPRDGGPPWNELHDAAARLLNSAAGAIGVGGVATAPSQLPRSYAEAQRALRIRQASAVPGGVTAFDELGIYRLLAAGDGAEAEHFVREWLGVLLDYDAANHTELVPTLWRYYECGGNYDHTAQALVIHRSTLRYRLRRIRQLTGHDLNAVDSRLNLHVATRAWRVMHGRS